MFNGAPYNGFGLNAPPPTSARSGPAGFASVATSPAVAAPGRSAAADAEGAGLASVAGPPARPSAGAGVLVGLGGYNAIGLNAPPPGGAGGGAGPLPAPGRSTAADPDGVGFASVAASPHRADPRRSAARTPEAATTP